MAAASVALGVSGSVPSTRLTSCTDPFVYDAHIDEVIPVEMVGGLKTAVPARPARGQAHLSLSSLAGLLRMDDAG